MQKDSKCMHFLVCLHFSIIHSLYSDVNLKPKQVICLENIFWGEDILAVLPTGQLWQVVNIPTFTFNSVS